MIEHSFGGPRFHSQIALDRGVDVLLALGGKLLFVRLAPRVSASGKDLNRAIGSSFQRAWTSAVER